MSDLIIRTALDDSGLTQQVKGLHRKFQTAFRAVKAVAIPAAVIAGAAALAEKLSDVARASADSIKPLGDQARALGISAERFQELRVLTDQQGASTAVLEASLLKLSDTLGKMATGAGARTEKRLTAIGVSLRDNQGRVVGVSEAWDILSAKISSGALTQQQAVGAATAAFGEQGAKLIQVLSATKAQQDAIIREAHKLGAIIPEDAIRNAQLYSDKLGLIGQGTKALQDQRNLALAPLAVEWELLKNAIAQATVNWSQFLGVIERPTGEVELFLELQRMPELIAKAEAAAAKAGGNTRAQAQRRLDELRAEQKAMQERHDMLVREREERNKPRVPAAAAEDEQLEFIEVAAQRIEVMRSMEQAMEEIRNEAAAAREAARVDELVRVNEWNQALIDAEEMRAAHERKLDEEDAEREKKKDEMRRAALSATVAGFADAFGAMSAHSKKSFKLSKSLSQANAVLNTYEAVTAALADKTVPTYVRFALAAVAAAKGAAQVGAIRRTEFGGGTTPTVAGTPTVGGVPVQANQTLRVEGISSASLFGGDAVRDLAQRLLDFQRDGGRVVLVE
jgi:hypothetical protein